MADHSLKLIGQYEHFQKAVSVGQFITVKPSKTISSEHYPNEYKVTRNDLYEELKPLIIFGRITFILPWKRSTTTSWRKLGLSFYLIPTLVTGFLIAWALTFAYFGVADLVEKGSRGNLGVLTYVTSFHPVSISIMDIIVYVCFLKNSNRFYQIFERWDEITSRVQLEKDKKLRLMSFMLIVYPVAQTAFRGYLLYTLFISVGRFFPGKSWLEIMNKVWMKRYKFPYHPAISIVCFLLQLVNHSAYYFVTPLIVMLSRVLSYQFKMLIEEASGCKVENVHYADVTAKDKLFWTAINQKHKALTALTKTVSVFLSPIIFWWTVYNIYTIAIQLYRALFGMDTTSIPRNLFLASFLLEIGPFLVTVICATKVNTYAIKIINLLRNCPLEHYYDTEIYRLEHTVLSGPTIAFTGLESFEMTRTFLIKIFNAVFTIEIMLLQAAEAKK